MQKLRFFRLTAFTILAGAFLVFTGCDSGGSNAGGSNNGGSQNQAPSASITVSSSTVDVGTQVVLDGSGSSDPDGDDLTYSWSLSTPNGSNASLSDASAEKPTFTPDESGDYTATLQVSDGNATDSEDATVTAESETVKISSDITSDRTLSPDNTYLVTSSICVENSSTLTIEAGVLLEFESGTSLKVCGDGSALVAQGTSSDGITMTGTTEQAGFWNGIGMKSANPNNELSYVTIEYAGGDNIYTYSSASALQLRDGATIAISNSTFRNNSGYGISADDGSVTFSAFSSNTFQNNGTTSMNIHASNLGVPDAASSYGSHVYVYGGRINGQTLTVSNIGVPYRISGVRDIEGGSDVTLEAGVAFEFESAAGLRIEGDATAFKAVGTSSNPITFTGTTNDKGFWNGIAIKSSNTNNEMTHVTVEYGGKDNMYVYSTAANIQIRNGHLTLTESLIQESAAYGLSKEGNDASVTESNNTYQNNDSGARNF